MLPARERALRIGGAIYALACVATFAVDTPLGGNVTRLGGLLAGPLLLGALLRRREGTPEAGGAARPATLARGAGGAARPATLVRGAGGAPTAVVRPARLAMLASLALGLAYWQAYPAVRDVVRASGDPSTAAAYHAPLVRFLESRPDRRGFRVEIPFTENHWEAAYVAPHVALARGWERQLDRRYGELFYDGALDAARYRAWLDEHAVAYVAVPDVPLDYSAREEAKLVAERPPYLRLIWRGAHWRVFAVHRPAPLVSGAARSIELQPDGFALRAGRRGDALVRVRHTRWWTSPPGARASSAARTA